MHMVMLKLNLYNVHRKNSEFIYMAYVLNRRALSYPTCTLISAQVQVRLCKLQHIAHVLMAYFWLRVKGKFLLEVVKLYSNS